MRGEPSPDRITAELGARLAEAARRAPLLLVALGVVLYATGPVMVRASNVSGPVFSFWRLWIGVGVFGVLAAAHAVMTGRSPDRVGWTWAARAGVAFGIHQLFFMVAVKATSVVDVALVGTMSPIVVGVLAIPMFGERPGWAFRAWTVVAVGGSAVVVATGSTGADGDPAGMALAVLNVVAFSFFFMWSKAGRDHIDVVPFLFGVMVCAAVTVSAYVAVAGEPVGSLDRKSALLALGVAVGPGALGHFVMTWPLRWIPANVPPVMRLAQPWIAGLLAWWLLSEPIGLGHVVGGLLTIVGVAGALLSPAGQRLTRQAAPAAELD